MKKLEIDEDDKILFNNALEPFLYAVYKQNTKDVRRMIKQQSQGFWIQFVTSFRSYIEKSGLLNGYCTQDEENEYEEAFINMLNILTIQNRFVEFTPLVESVKDMHVIIQSTTEPLFTGPMFTISVLMRAKLWSNFQQPLSTFKLYTRFVSALVVLYIRSTSAPRVRERTPPAKWNPPANWYQNVKGPSKYEKYLWEKWGSRLYNIVSVAREKIFLFEERGNSNTSASKTQNRKKRTNENLNGKQANIDVTNRNSNVGNPSVRNKIKKRKGKRRGKNKKYNVSQVKKNVASNTKTPSDSETEDKNVSTKESYVNEESSSIQPGTSASKSNTSEGCEFKRVPSYTCTHTCNEKCKLLKDENLHKYSNVENERKQSNEVNGNNTRQNLKHEEKPSKLDDKERENAGKYGVRDSFRYDRIFNFSQTRSEKNSNNEVGSSSRVNDKISQEWNKNESSTVSSKSNVDKSEKTDTGFMYNRLFNFSQGNRVTNEKPSTRSSENKVYSEKCKNKPVTDENKVTSNNTDFKYDRLFNFGERSKARKNEEINEIPSDGFSPGNTTRLDNVDVEANTDNSYLEQECRKQNETPTKKFIGANNENAKAKSHGTEFRYDRLFNFGKRSNEENNTKSGSTNSNNMKNTPDKSENKTEQSSSSKESKNEENKGNDSFKYDKLFNFGAKREESLSSEDSHDSSYFSDYEDENTYNFEDFLAEQMRREFFVRQFMRSRFKNFQHVRRKPVVPVRKFLLQKCSNCNKLEKKLGNFTECGYCVQEDVWIPKIYCDKVCKRMHWENGHSLSHIGRKFYE